MRAIKFIFKVIYHAAAVALILAAVAIVCWFLFVPHYAETRVLAQLDKLGLAGSAAHVTFIGPDRATVSDLGLGSDRRITVDSARITYSARDAAKGRFETLRLTGLQVRVGYNNGKFDLGELAKVHGGGGGGDIDLPLESIDLRSSMILLEMPGHTFRIPIAGTVTRTAPDTVDVELSGVVADRAVHIQGSVKLLPGGVSAPDLHVTASIPRVVPTGSLALSAIDADVRLGVEVGEQKIAVSAKSGATLVMQSISGTFQGIRFTPVAQDGPTATLKIGDKPAAFTMDRKTGAWGVTAPDLQMALTPVDIALLHYQVATQGVAATVHLAAEASAEKWSVALLEPAKVQAATITLPIADKTLRLDDTRLTLAAAGGPIASRESAKGPLKIAALITADQAIKISGDAAAGSFDTMTATIAAMLNADAPLALESEIGLGNGSLTYAPAAVVAKGIDLRLPIRMNAAGPAGKPGVFSVRELALGKDALPAISGGAAFRDGQLDIGSDWELAPKFVAHLVGEINAKKSHFTVNVPQTDIADPQTMGKLFAALKPIDLTGGVAVSGEATLVGGLFTPNIKIDLKDVNLGASAWDVKAEKVNGSVAITGFLPLSTPDAQQLTSSKVTFGKFEFKQGAVQFRLIDRQHLFLERTRFQLGESGNFLVHAMMVDFANPALETDVFLEDVNLGDWLTVLTGEKITGSGQLYGRVPVKFHPKDQDMISLGAGFIYSKPGEATLTVGDSKKVADLINRADPELAGNAQFAQIKQKAYEALSDFEYSMFRFDLVPEGDTVMLRVETRGKGRKGENPLEIGSLVVNVRGLEPAVNELLLVKGKLLPGR
jgi:hypothetical protein